MTIGLMTSGYDQPTAKIAPSLLVIVQNTLSLAWRELIKKNRVDGFCICTSTEDEITERLHLILGEFHAAGDDIVVGLSQFETSNREGKFRNYNGKNLDKQPDLSFRPLRGHIPSKNTVPTAIFIECKPIDSSHPVKSTYCRAGLVRFVNGDYSWAVDRAMMVGYVRNNCSLPGGLSTSFSDNSVVKDLSINGELVELNPTQAGDLVYHSIHERAFKIPDSTASVGCITIHHLWLKLQQPCEVSQCLDNTIK